MSARGKVATTTAETGYIIQERKAAARAITAKLYPGRREPYLPSGYSLRLVRLSRNRDGSLSGAYRVTGEWLVKAYIRNFRTPAQLNTGPRSSGFRGGLTG